MVNKPKAAGTREETWIVNTLQDAGFAAERLAEGGMHDLGDILIRGTWHELVVEAKARERLTIHSEVAKAKRKAGYLKSVVIWKRLVRKPGASRRTPVDGETRVVAMDLDTFLWLLGGRF